MTRVKPFVIVSLRSKALTGTIDIEVPTDVPASGVLAFVSADSASAVVSFD